MAYSPTFTKLRFLTLAAGAIAESGNGTIGYTYAGDGQANGADQSIGLSQEGAIRCKVNSGPASYLGLSSTNTSQDETAWKYGIQWYAGTNYYVIENGSTLGAPLNIGQQMVPGVDEIQLRKIGVTSSIAEVVVEVLPAGGVWGTNGTPGDEVIIYKFATKVTTTLYPALRTYVGSESMGPMIFQLGQAQARLPDNSAHMQGEGDSLMTMQLGYLQNLPPFVGCGVTWSDLSVAGSQWNLTGSLGMQNRTAAVNSDWVAGRSNGIIAGAGSNDNAINSKTNATIVTDATAWAGALTNPYALGKHLEGPIPRAGSYANQTARDTANGTGASGLKGLNTLFQSSYLGMGFNNFVDRRPTGSRMDLAAFLQANFDNAGIWYSQASFQEAWDGSIHPFDYLAYDAAKKASASMVAYMVPDVVLSDGPRVGIQGPKFARAQRGTQGGFAAGQTYSDSVPEAASLVDVQTAAGVFPKSDAEALALAEVQAGAWTTSSAAAEAMALSDAQTGGFAAVGATAEAMALADSETAAQIFGGSVVESVALADTESVAAAFAGTNTEALALSDVEDRVAIYSVALVESMSLADAEDGAVGANLLAESFTIADAQSAQAIYASAIAEAMGFADSETATGGASTGAGASSSSSNRKKKVAIQRRDGKIELFESEQEAENWLKAQAPKLEKAVAKLAKKIAKTATQAAPTPILFEAPVLLSGTEEIRAIVDMRAGLLQQKLDAEIARQIAQQEDDDMAAAVIFMMS